MKRPDRIIQRPRQQALLLLGRGLREPDRDAAEQLSAHCVRARIVFGMQTSASVQGHTIAETDATPLEARHTGSQRPVSEALSQRLRRPHLRRLSPAPLAVASVGCRERSRQLAGAMAQGMSCHHRRSAVAPAEHGPPRPQRPHPHLPHTPLRLDAPALTSLPPRILAQLPRLLLVPYRHCDEVELPQPRHPRQDPRPIAWPQRGESSGG